MLIVYWMMRLIRTKRKIRLHLWMTIPYLIIFALCIASLSRITTIQSSVKAGSLFLVIKNLILFLYIANNLSDRRSVFILIGVILLNGCFQSIVAIGQYVTGGPLGLGMLGETNVHSLDSMTRVGGTIGHPNKLALMLAFVLEINISVLFIPASWKIKLLRIFPMLLMFPAVLITYSRGAWASLVLGGSINFYWCRSKKTQQKIISAVVVFVVFAGLAFVSVGLVPSVRNRIFGDDNGSADIRIPLKVIAKNIINHHYWLGVGLNNYVSVIRKYDNSQEGASLLFPMPVHNEYLLIAAELGIPAAIVFIILLCLIFGFHLSIGRTSVDPAYPYLAIGFLCGWIGWCLHHRSLFEYALFQHDIWFYLGIAQALKNNLKT
ncbi:MAG: hypothetical protein D3924_14350 [Candidatus Electrothrix sp. AR4]|nr:hypothetical protein [Candidatus Electrothrix sp. AR4]